MKRRPGKRGGPAQAMAVELAKARLLHRMHRGLRPKLSAEQRKQLSMAHNVNIDAIARGEATPSLMWEYFGGVLCWWKAAQLCDWGQPEMEVQLDLATRLVERYAQHGRVLFTGPDLELARNGVVQMDLIAAEVDLANATAAADWAEIEMRRVEAAHQQQLQLQGEAA